MKHCYSDAIVNTSVALLGIIPPPYGGVSVHIKRVRNKLEQQGNQVFFFCTEPRGRTKFFPFYLLSLVLWLLIKRPRVVVYHSLYLTRSVYELHILVWFKRLYKSKLLLVAHDPRHVFAHGVKFCKSISAMHAYIDHFVCIGASTYQSYLHAGVTLPSHTVECAFVPPDVQNASSSFAHQGDDLNLFCTIKKPLLVVYAGNLMRENEKDIYGIDQAIAMMRLLLMRYPQAGILIALYPNADPVYENTLKEYVHRNGIADACFWMHTHQELWPLMKRASLFLRPTLSDGSSVSIQEALFFNVPVVASDIVARDSRVTLFKTGNVANFAQQVCKVLNERAFENKKINQTHP